MSRDTHSSSRFRLTSSARALALVVALGACESDRAPSGPAGPLEIPAFAFVSEVGGVWQIFRYEQGQVVQLTSTTTNEDQPHSAAGQIVFVSERDGNREIYLGPLDLATAQRITTSGAVDDEPALSPAGDQIAFVSTRSGSRRLWLVDAQGGTAVALASGSSSSVPESAPAWSPSGDQIAFTSLRTGTSQVFILSTGDGTVRQLSQESGGAFSPAWSSDGSTIYYVTTIVAPRVRAISVATGEARDFAIASAGVSEPECDAALCLAVDGAGDISAYATEASQTEGVLVRAETDRSPAILRP